VSDAVTQSRYPAPPREEHLELNGSPAFKPGLAKSSPTLSEAAGQPLAFREIECGVCPLVANVLAGPNSSATGNSRWSGPTA